MEKEKMVRSSKGIGMGIILVLILIGFYGCFEIIRWAMSFDPIDRTTIVIACVFFLVGIHGSLSIASEQNIVTLKGIKGRIHGEPKELDWKQVSSISVSRRQSFPPFGYNISIHQSDSSWNSMPVYAFYYANSHEIAKAIIEAALIENAEVSIDDELLKIYGKPPYGIFIDL